MKKSLTPRNDNETEIPSLLNLWLLRLLVPLGASRNLHGPFGYQNIKLAECLGLTKLDFAGDDIQVFKSVIEPELRRLHEIAEENCQTASYSSTLTRNIRRLKKLVGLSEIECRILEFAVIIHTDDLLSDVADWLGHLSSKKACQVLSILLGVSAQEMRKALSAPSVSSRSGLVALVGGGERTLRKKLDLLSVTFADNLVSSISDPAALLQGMVAPGLPPQLVLSQFEHIAKSLKVMRPYLAHAVAAQRPGVNIFIYGAPGTGKTQLARVLGKDLGCELFEVACENAEGAPIDGDYRIRAFRAAQSFFARRRVLILFDEVDNILNVSDGPFGHSGSVLNNKAWLNRKLESNQVPTLWISNTIDSIDPAIIRRFDMVIELPTPPKKQREQIILAACGDMLPGASVGRIAAAESLAPAVISRTAAVMRAIRTSLPANEIPEAMEHLISNTLAAQGHLPLAKAKSGDVADLYDLKCVNASVALQDVVAGIAKTREGRICIYGPPGTGKTAFGRWLADSIGMPLHVRRASELLSKWVGGTERNIARAFREASEEGALLLLDEVDSFLHERKNVLHTWEITGVNEMLSQMESFDGVLIATTNLMEDLDQAALRRFELKVKFEYLKQEQAWTLLEAHCQSLDIPPPPPDLNRRLGRLDALTPGDFAAISRLGRIRPLCNAGDFIAALETECSLKKGHGHAAIGFL